MGADGRKIVLGSETHRQFVGSLVATSAPGSVVTIEPPRRTLDQNAALHSALGEIADQLAWPPDSDEFHTVEWWKRRCTLTWLREIGTRPEVITTLDGEDFGLLIPHTSDLSVAKLSEFLEWCIAFGAQNGVKFKR